MHVKCPIFVFVTGGCELSLPRVGPPRTQKYADGHETRLGAREHVPCTWSSRQYICEGDRTPRLGPHDETVGRLHCPSVDATARAPRPLSSTRISCLTRTYSLCLAATHGSSQSLLVKLGLQGSRNTVPHKDPNSQSFLMKLNLLGPVQATRPAQPQQPPQRSGMKLGLRGSKHDSTTQSETTCSS